MKNRTLPVAVAVAIIGCVLAVSANVTTNEIHKSLNQERYKRMVAEEQLTQANNELKKMDAALQDSQTKLDSIEKVLNNGKSKTSDLESRLQTLSDENAALRAKMEGAQQQPPPVQPNPAPTP